ncbi:MAG: signal peptidase I [Oscillospiraceae bacterium]
MKKAVKVILNAVAWIILVFALLITILVFTADRNNGVASLLGYIPLTVESDSMKPTFAKDDLIIDKEIDDVKSLKEGDVITFWTIIDGKKVKNTHRIIKINEYSGSVCFTTKGDNNSIEDSLDVYPADIIGKWTETKIGGFGKVMSFLRTKTGFFICILIPMAIFFLFELYKLIVVIVEIKRPAAAEIDEEEIKRKAIEEYLAEQGKASLNETANETAKAAEEKNDGDNGETDVKDENEVKDAEE